MTFRGYVHEVFSGEKFTFNIRRPKEMNGSIVNYEKFKESDPQNKQVSNNYNWETKIVEPYEDIVDAFKVREGDEMVFQFRIENRCGISSQYSEFYQYQFENAEFHLID